MLNPDTHILLFALDGSVAATWFGAKRTNGCREERRLLAGNPWGVSAIVVWEVAKLAQPGRIGIDVELRKFSRIFVRVHVWPLNLAVCRQSRELDFESDPADELLAATSIIHRVPLLSRDRKIRRSRLVPIASA